MKKFFGIVILLFLVIGINQSFAGSPQSKNYRIKITDEHLGGERPHSTNPGPQISGRGACAVGCAAISGTVAAAASGGAVAAAAGVIGAACGVGCGVNP